MARIETKVFRDSPIPVNQTPLELLEPEAGRADSSESRKANGTADVSPSAHAPWPVDRFGRLIAGCSMLLFTMMALVHNMYWIGGSLLCAINLILTAVTDRCALRALLLRLGAREREDLFLPGGRPRRIR